VLFFEGKNWKIEDIFGGNFPDPEVADLTPTWVKMIWSGTISTGNTPTLSIREWVMGIQEVAKSQFVEWTNSLNSNLSNGLACQIPKCRIGIQLNKWGGNMPHRVRKGVRLFFIIEKFRIFLREIFQTQRKADPT